MEPLDNNGAGTSDSPQTTQADWQPSIADPTAMNTSTSGMARTSVSVNAQVPAGAEDADLIEPTWVNAVKHTIEQYKHDPYSQSKAMTLLREEYLRKRYGKDIKDAQQA